MASIQTQPPHPVATDEADPGDLTNAPRSVLPDNAGPNHTLVSTFEEQVAKTPKRSALRTDSGELTYAELNAIANRIGHAILARHDGTSPAVVALIFRHGAEKIAAAFGVLKAGLTYAAINESLPDQGISELIAHTQCSIVLTDDDNYWRVRSLAEEIHAVINFSDLGDDLPDAPLAVTSEPDSVAFIVYTSGSTGAPKGVAYTHAAALHIAKRSVEACDIVEQDRISVFDNFGSSTVYGALLNGACLCPFSLRRRGLSEVATWLKRHEITLVRSFPTVFRELVASLRDGERLTAMRCISLAGEPLRQADLDDFRKHFRADCMFVPAYGATEFSISAASRHLVTEQMDIDKLSRVYALDGVEILIVDDDGKEVPPGETGQIAIRSQYMSSGYWRRSELTACHYLPDPDGGTIGIMVPGDLGRLDENGALTVLGRKDHQVKIRNHRVIPADIESALMGHASVHAAAVHTFVNCEGDLRLAGYVVARDETAPSSAELREFLRPQLAEYMVPSVIVLMDALPLTSTGKVDRNALPKPAGVARDDPASYLAPRNDLEKELAAFWEELLGLTGVGVRDDFFDLGGDSLQATNLILKVDRHYGVELAPEAVFDSACTIAGLAQEIEKVRERFGHEQASAGDTKSASVRDIDFVEFGVTRRIHGKAELFYIDPETSLRRAKPNVSLGPITFNSLGFRSPEISMPKPDGTIRLAFLGASGTLDSHVSSNDKTWPHRTWRALCDAFPNRHIDYVNAALPGDNSQRMTLLWEHFVARLEPDIVIIQASDVNADTAYAARAQGIYKGVHYRPSWLARRSLFLEKIEKNLIIAKRLTMAWSGRRKLKAEPFDVSREFEGRLKRLVELCQSTGAKVVLISGSGRLRRDQSGWQQLRASATNVFYMPYLTISRILEFREVYQRVVQAVGQQTGAFWVDVSEDVPGDRSHFVDSKHFSDEGSAVMAQRVAKALIEEFDFQQL